MADFQARIDGERSAARARERAAEQAADAVSRNRAEEAARATVRARKLVPELHEAVEALRAERRKSVKALGVRRDTRDLGITVIVGRGPMAKRQGKGWFLEGIEIPWSGPLSFSRHPTQDIHVSRGWGSQSGGPTERNLTLDEYVEHGYWEWTTRYADPESSGEHTSSIRADETISAALSAIAKHLASLK